jgi:hypothetical protein
MKRNSSRKSNSLSASQEITSVLYNPNVHFYVKSPQLKPILKHFNPLSMPTTLDLLNLTTLISVKKYQLLNSSCNFLQPPLTSLLLESKYSL